MDEEDEVALKAKLDQTEDIEERRDLRKRIREIRNAKFEEELKKISSGDKTTSTLTTDIATRRPTRAPTIDNDAGEDPYGLLEYTTEASLQDLLNATPFTETDKRRKIRARMRDVRNAEFDKTIVTSTRSSTRERVKPSSDEPVQKPAREPSPEPVREPSPEPVREPSPEPVREPSPEPVRTPSPEPVREPSPEPIREPSPEPVREPSPEPSPELSREASPEPQSDEDEPSSEMRKEESESASEGESPFEDEYSDEGDMGGDAAEDRDNDFTERLKTREDVHAVLSLERPLAQGGEQVDFRDLLKRKSETPAVNLERKPMETEQVDFRVALERKVEVPQKKEEIPSGEQVDFRFALKKKVEKPVFDKTPEPAAQVDFRSKLTRNVRTVTIEDKELSTEQKDFRPVLGKAPPSPKTGRRHKRVTTQESVDRSASPEPIEVNKMEALPERVVSPIEDNQDATSSPDVSRKESLKKKVAKKAPPPPPPAKKKPPIPKPTDDDQKIKDENESLPSSPSSMEITSDSVDAPGSVSPTTEETNYQESTQEELNNQESDDEVDGVARNKQVARAERTRRRQEAKEAAAGSKNIVDDKTSTDNNVDDKSTAEKSSRRRSKKSETETETRAEVKPERSNRRARRLQALEGEETTTPKKKEEDKENEVKAAESTLTKNSQVKKDAVNGTPAPKEKVNKTETPRKDSKPEPESEASKETEPEDTEVTTPMVNGDIEMENDVDDKKESAASGKNKEEEKVEVSSDLLAEINRPKEEPKKPSVESQVKKNTSRSATPLTGKAAERERERLKREEEREAKAAQRAKEREEAARKRKEQKDAFEKKMAEQRKLREMKNRNLGASSTARASRNAFKEKLESASPRSESPSRIKVDTNLTKLLGWARKRTRDYTDKGVNVENFSDSWSDGLAFAALIHSFRPDLIPIDDLSKETRRRNFEIAFSAARDEGVMDLLDVEDMVTMRSPDPKSVMTYVHSIYQTFQTQEAGS